MRGDASLTNSKEGNTRSNPPTHHPRGSWQSCVLGVTRPRRPLITETQRADSSHAVTARRTTVFVWRRASSRGRRRDAVVGQPVITLGDHVSGIARVFVRSAGTWSEAATDSSDGAADDALRRSVSISGDRSPCRCAGAAVGETPNQKGVSTSSETPEQRVERDAIGKRAPRRPGSLGGPRRARELGLDFGMSSPPASSFSRTATASLPWHPRSSGLRQAGLKPSTPPRSFSREPSDGDLLGVVGRAFGTGGRRRLAEPPWTPTEFWWVICVRVLEPSSGWHGTRLRNPPASSLRVRAHLRNSAGRGDRRTTVVATSPACLWRIEFSGETTKVAYVFERPSIAVGELERDAPTPVPSANNKIRIPTSLSDGPPRFRTDDCPRQSGLTVLHLPIMMAARSSSGSPRRVGRATSVNKAKIYRIDDSTRQSLLGRPSRSRERGSSSALNTEKVDQRRAGAAHVFEPGSIRRSRRHFFRERAHVPALDAPVPRVQPERNGFLSNVGFNDSLPSSLFRRLDVERGYRVR